MARPALIRKALEEGNSSILNRNQNSIDSVTSAATFDLVNESQGAIENSDLGPQLPTSLPAHQNEQEKRHRRNAGQLQ